MLSLRAIKNYARTGFVLSAVLTCLVFGLAGEKVYAHVAVPGNVTADAIEHARGNLGSSQSKRHWADTPYCETEVDRVALPDGPGGRPRAVYKFKVFANANARAHAMEAGAFADSTQAHCTNWNNGAWNGNRVDLDNDLFKVGGKKPVRATIGVTNADESHPGVGYSIPDYDFDTFLRLVVGIRSSSNGGAYGWEGDAGGYKINGQVVWCAGLDMGPIDNPYAPGVGTNVRWPGYYWGDCAGSFMFDEGSGNYQTHWGAYTIGAMVNGSAVRCGGCALGNNIPGMSLGGDGTMNDFDLEAAGFKNHDGVGTFNYGDGVPAAYYPSADDAAADRENPFRVPVSEAWVTMEWDLSSRGGVQVTKYPHTSGPDANGHATGPWANPSSDIGDQNICILPGVGCNNGNPMSVFNAPDALPGGVYEIDINPPTGYRVKEVRAQYGGFLHLPYFTITDPDGDGRYRADIGTGFGANNTLYFDIYYEPETPAQLTCSVRIAPTTPEPGQAFNIYLTYTYVSGSGSMSINGRVRLPDSSPAVDRTYSDTVNPGDSEEIRITSTTVTISSAGEYTITANVQRRSGSLNYNCPLDFEVANKPYFKVWSNDAQVGGNFAGADGNCSPPNAFEDATIIGYGGETTDLSNRFIGASAEFGTFALGEVRNFFSAGRRSPRSGAVPTWPTPPHGLTFGNFNISPDIPSGDPGDSNKVVNYGGHGEISHCTDDWMATMPDPISNINADVTTPVQANVVVNAGGSGAQHITRASGIVKIGGGNVTGPRAIFVSDSNPAQSQVDVVISDDITANDGATLYIITTGNIKIAANVEDITAVLVSEKTLHTCTRSGGNPWTASELFASCGASTDSGKLTVTGAVIANEIKLQRTYGSRRRSQENEGTFTVHGGGNPNHAAEEFIFDPTLYRNAPLLEQTNPNNTTIDFITSLPPVL